MTARRERSVRLDPSMPAARLYTDPCSRCEVAYSAALERGRFVRIMCPVCGRLALRPAP